MPQYNPTTEELLPIIKRHCEKLELPYNEEHKRNLLATLTLDNSFKLLLDNKAYFIAMLTPNPMSGEMMAFELAFYSEEKGLGATLLKEYEAWARTKGLKKITVASQEAFPIDNYLVRKGYKALERTFVKEL